ncbi:MAG: hypothetical protein XD49_1374 [Caldanaerobacter subterraneus]|nr:MAG: hypothetical protein XD49_1374 [Caldanaerobacter subterraneus]
MLTIQAKLVFDKEEDKLKLFEKLRKRHINGKAYEKLNSKKKGKEISTQE